MFNSVLDYQQQYFKTIFNFHRFSHGYYTQSQDLEYINSNTIVVGDDSAEALYEVCSLLTERVYACKIQLPQISVVPADELDTISLIKYTKTGMEIDPVIGITLVDEMNYVTYNNLSKQLQIQEYGKEYKKMHNNDYLNQTTYQLYLIKYGDECVGEFMYIPSLNAVEEIIILSKYQRLGIMRNCLELISKDLSETIFLSADRSSIGFYQRINCQIIDQIDVLYLYGSPRNLLMYLSLSI